MSDVEKNSGTHKPEFDGEWVPISQVYDLQMGKTPSRDAPEYWNNGDHNWVSIKDLGSYGKYVGKTSETISERGRKESGIKAVPADTLLMSFKLSLGKASITTEETFTNEAIMAFLDKGAYEVDIDYMWHQLRSKDWSAGTNTAVMGKTLNKKTLGSTLIRVPPIAKQREVARRLDSVENVLSLLGREKNTLDDLVKSQFIEMFGTLEEPRSGIELKTIDSICTSIVRGPFGSALKKEYFVPWHPGVYKVYEQKNAIRKQADIGDYYIEEAKFGELGRFECVPGDILMSCSGTMGELYQLPNDAVPGVINQALCKFTLDSKQILAPYFLEIMSQAVGELGAKGSGIQNIASVKYVKAVRIPVPPVELQRQFADLVARVDKLGFDVRQQIDKLEILKKSLMQEYFG